MIRLTLILLLTSCQAHIGVAYHPENEQDGKNYNPLGVVRIKHETKYNTELFCEHVSSIPRENDHGLNMCGALWRVN